MAARDNTALHAALIIMVLLTVALAISTYVLFGASEEAKKISKDRQNQLNEAKAQVQTLNSELRVLKFVTGWDTSGLTLADVEGEITALGDKGAAAQQVFNGYKADVATYGEGLQNADYRKIPEHLLAALKSKNEQLAAAIVKQRELESEKDSVTRRETERAKEFEKNAQKAQSDLAAQIAAHDGERTKWNSEKDGLKKQVTDLGTQVNQVKSESQKEVKSAKDEVVRVKREMDIVRTELSKYRTHENFEVPDGQITSVNQKTGTVFVNIGSSAGLRKQVMFSVYDRSENSATASQKKAGIEIVRVVDENTSEGRIVYTQNTNPILPGDNIYSPVWSTGPRLHFAVGGWFDLDNDGNNDRELVRSLIERNGGVVDMYQGEDGKPVGTMSVETRYLVDIADLPTKAIADDRVERIRTGRNSMRTQAQELGVKILHVNELLDWMGWKPQDKTIVLGVSSSLDASNRAKAAAGESGEFRRREPPAR